ncbi:MAG: FAD-binding oxidoreductase [Pseudomonadota bacterium]
MTTSEPHTGSYYAATLNDATRYAPLQGDHVADVCVVGGGFTGISTALHLTESGYNVHVVEANRVGWGASGRNGGQLIGGIAGEHYVARKLGRDVDELFGELRWAGHEIIKERVSTYNIDCDLKFGYLDVAIKPRHIADLHDECERLTRINFPHEYRMLSAEETLDTIGTDVYIGSMLNMANGHLHPLNLCLGEARAAVELGATISEDSKVVAIGDGARPRVVTNEGSVTADAVVLAGNAYHSLHPKLRGIMFPVNSFIIGTAPLDPAIVEEINPMDVAVCDPNFVLEYFRLTADKRLLFGGRCNSFGFDPRVIEKNLRPRMQRIYPQLKDVRVDFAWGGTIGVPLTRVPQLGKLSSNLYFCQGYSGHGVNVTHLAGRIMADAVAGTLEHFDLFANIKPVTVPGADLLKRPLVALGLVYYQLRDRLG